MSRGVFLHDRSLCESDDVGEGTRIWAFAHVMKGARLGRDCNVGDHAYIEAGAVVGDRVTIKNGVSIWDKVTLEDDVFVGPNAVFTNDRLPRAAFRTPPELFEETLVQQGASIGANATIMCGLTIGRHALIGAGTVVLRDVPDHALVVGNPARQLGWVCMCGRKLDTALACSCGRRFAQGADGLEPAAST